MGVRNEPPLWAERPEALPEHQRRVLESLLRCHPVEVSGIATQFAEPLCRSGLVENTSGEAPDVARVSSASSYKLTRAGLIAARQVVGNRPVNSVAEFFAEAERLKLTVEDLLPGLIARPEFADCLSNVAGMQAKPASEASGAE